MGEAGEGFGLRRHGRGHRIDDGVDLLLSEFGELRAGLAGTADECARLLDGREIAIGLGGRGLCHA